MLDWSSPTSSDWCPCKERFKERREKPAERRRRQSGSDAATRQEPWCPQQQETPGSGFPWKLWREEGPADPWSWDFLTQGQERLHCCWLPAQCVVTCPSSPCEWQTAQAVFGHPGVGALTPDFTSDPATPSGRTYSCACIRGD